MTGVCFPESQIENKMPHMTMLLGQWQAKNSNDALEATCSNDQHPFYPLYEKARLGQGMGESKKIEGVKILGQTVDAFFVVLDSPVIFDGDYHDYF